MLIFMGSLESGGTGKDIHGEHGTQQNMYRAIILIHTRTGLHTGKQTAYHATFTSAYV